MRVSGVAGPFGRLDFPWPQQLATSQTKPCLSPIPRGPPAHVRAACETSPALPRPEARAAHRRLSQSDQRREPDLPLLLTRGRALLAAPSRRAANKAREPGDALDNS